jgi:hypothetical protein
MATTIAHPCGVTEIRYDSRPDLRIFKAVAGPARDFTEYVFTTFSGGQVSKVTLFRRFNRLWIRGKDAPMEEDLPLERAVLPAGYGSAPGV